MSIFSKIKDAIFGHKSASAQAQPAPAPQPLPPRLLVKFKRRFRSLKRSRSMWSRS